MKNIQSFIEHTSLSPVTSQKEIEKLIEEALRYQFYGICVPPYWVKKAKRDLGRTNIRLVTVAGFPLGYNMSQTKASEMLRAIDEGAEEIDVVLNLSAFRADSGSWAKIEVAQFARLCHEQNVLLKVILETAYLTDEEIVKICRFCRDAGADFVKTSTGFAPGGATVHHVKLMKQTVGDSVGVKASGGIKTLKEAEAMLAAGAERIGTSSGVQIMEEARIKSQSEASD